MTYLVCGIVSIQAVSMLRASFTRSNNSKTQRIRTVGCETNPAPRTIEGSNTLYRLDLSMLRHPAPYAASGRTHPYPSNRWKWNKESNARLTPRRFFSDPQPWPLISNVYLAALGRTKWWHQDVDDPLGLVYFKTPAVARRAVAIYPSENKRLHVAAL